MSLKFTHGGGVYKFEWPDVMLTLMVDRVHHHRDGHATGELLVTTTAPGFGDEGHILSAQFNLSSVMTRRSMGKALADRFTGATSTWWDAALETVCVTTIRKAREGSPVVLVGAELEYELNPNKFLLAPVILDKRPVTLFAEGGVGKSWLALYFGLRLQKGDGAVQRNVLYLDWETDEDEIRERLHMLQHAVREPTGIAYRRCSAPFADDVDAIHREMVKHDLNYVIFDSLGGACGGDIEKAETALRFYQAYRSLEVGSLWVTHVAKNGKKDRTPFGSAYFWNYSRSIWEVVRQQSQDGTSISVGMYHRKINGARLFKATGYTFAFGDGWAVVEEIAPGQIVTKVPAIEDKMTDHERIFNILRHGAKSVKEIADRLGKDTKNPEGAVRSTLDRGEESFVKRPDGTWGIKDGA